MPHPVRGNFDDPRGHDFHFGIDISAPRGAVVYATLSGRAYLHPGRPNDAVRVESAAGDGRRFEYWHIVPLIHQGQWAVAYRTRLGVVKKGAGHVHFAEFMGAQALNPLRSGALWPYYDTTAPRVSLISFHRDLGKANGSSTASAGFGFLVDAYDEPQLRAPPPFERNLVTPALIRWRILRGVNPRTPWRTAMDFRRLQPPRASFGTFYARGTRANRPHRPGRYRFYLEHPCRLSDLPAARYRLQIAVSDTRGNVSRALLDFKIRPH